MQSLPQAVVVLAGARDHYQLPLALQEAGLLHRLVTDMYWPADRGWFSRSAGRLLPSHILAARYCAGLDSRRVRISAQALGADALMKTLRTARFNRHKDRALSRKARQLAVEKGVALFAYSYYASEAFKDMGEMLPHRYLFQLHPHPAAVRAILREEIERVPQARSSLMAEHELALPDREFAEMASEPHLANGWVVACGFIHSHGPHGLFGVNLERDLQHEIGWAEATVRFAGWYADEDQFLSAF